MKKIEAVIRRDKFTEVDEALRMLGVYGSTFDGPAERGLAREEVMVCRGASPVDGYVPYMRLEIIVNGVEMRKVVDTIAKAAATGEAGDGRILVTPLDETVDIAAEAMEMTAAMSLR